MMTEPLKRKRSFTKRIIKHCFIVSIFYIDEIVQSIVFCFSLEIFCIFFDLIFYEFRIIFIICIIVKWFVFLQTLLALVAMALPISIGLEESSDWINSSNISIWNKFSNTGLRYMEFWSYGSWHSISTVLVIPFQTFHFFQISSRLAMQVWMCSYSCLATACICHWIAIPMW